MYIPVYMILDIRTMCNYKDNVISVMKCWLHMTIMLYLLSAAQKRASDFLADLKKRNFRINYC